MRMHLWTISAIAVLAAGCGGADSGEAAPEAGGEGHRVLLDSAERPLEKARGVEDLNLQRKDALDAEIEESQR